MDAIEILGDLLGHKSKQSGRGSDILKDIFGRKSQRSSGSPPRQPVEINREATELEELLNVANDRSLNRKTSSSRARPQQTKSIPQQRPSPPTRDTTGSRKQDVETERAIMLIRAMVNASKADGKIDADEQQKIIEKMGNASRANIDFLRKLFAEPLNVQEFVRSVPLGMEQQVYTMSLIAIDLDEGSEADYLMQLAQGLRIPADVREQIHQRLGAPSVY